jgi:hypothetical protein
VGFFFFFFFFFFVYHSNVTGFWLQPVSAQGDGISKCSGRCCAIQLRL